MAKRKWGSGRLSGGSEGSVLSIVEKCLKEVEELLKLHSCEEELECLAHSGEENGTIDETPSSLQRRKIAVLLEGSRMPFSKLVRHIFEKLKEDSELNARATATLASVRSTVLSIGERMSFGYTSPDSDVLEDKSKNCLWRWEVRDIKLLPDVHHSAIVSRRETLKKVAEHLKGLSAIIAASIATATTVKESIEADQSLSTGTADLPKDLQESDCGFRNDAVVLELLQKKVNKDVAKKPKVSPNDFPGEPSDKQENGKGRRRSGGESAKERVRQEKKPKIQQEDPEKEQKRKEREEAERKKQLALQKQASFMDRFLQKKDQATCDQNCANETKVSLTSSGKDSHDGEKQASVDPKLHAIQALIAEMDQELHVCQERSAEDLKRAHLTSWQSLHRHHCSQRVQRWGSRRKPKVTLYKELRLQGTAGASLGSPQDSPLKKDLGNWTNTSNLELTLPSGGSECTDDLLAKESALENLSNGSTNTSSDTTKIPNACRFLLLQKMPKKLLQFDKSHRPAYYGTLLKRCGAIGPRHPFKQDSSLDYAVESDEEWEEEDPGESLSDCEKDEEDEKVETLEEDEDSADEFVVPDGYLSENEGVHLEDAAKEGSSEGALQTHTPGKSVSGVVAEQNLATFERLQKLLDNTTEHALRTNHAVVFSNLGEDTLSSPAISVSRTESLCLEALRMQVLAPRVLIVPIEESVILQRC